MLQHEQEHHDHERLDEELGDREVGRSVGEEHQREPVARAAEEERGR